MNEINMNGEDELENIASDLYADHAGLIKKDANHSVDDVYQYEIGEGTTGEKGSIQRDVADTGEHGLGGDQTTIDNSNVEATQDEEEDNEENKNNLRIV